MDTTKPSDSNNNKTTTEYTLATAVQDGTAPDQPVYRPGMKQGHKCCGGCCDVRRAVIIVNIINACFLVMGILSFLAIQNLDAESLSEQDAAALADMQGLPLGVVIAISVVKLALNLLGIYGALKYNIVMVGLCCAVYCVDALMALIVFNVVTLLYAGFFAYPHFFFIKEVKAGIMTKENYHINEEQSCCCV